MTLRPTRREFLASGALALAGSSLWQTLSGCGGSSSSSSDGVVGNIDPRQSPFGFWSIDDGLPVFVYDADHETLPQAEWDPIIRPRTRRQWHMFGNRAIQVQADNHGTVALFDESHGLRWLTGPDPDGTGVSIIREEDGTTWSSYFPERPGEMVPERIFGPTHFEVCDRLRGLELGRTILCPEGEVPWVLVRVVLRLDPNADVPRSFVHSEQWILRPRFVNLFIEPEQQRETALREVSYRVDLSEGRVRAREVFAEVDGFNVFGPPATILLERLDGVGVATATGSPHPTLAIETPLTLAPGDKIDLFFRFGRDDGQAISDPTAFFAEQRQALTDRLPRAAAAPAPEAEQEIPWHLAALTGGSSIDRIIGGHTLNQASTYSFVIGFNAAARDPLQHALPLVYSEPDLALSALRNTCAWADPDGDLPYSLEGAKTPFVAGFRPSDQNLWALWLAAEYAAATGDLTAFDQPLAYHPQYGGAAPLREHLRRQFRFFVDTIGRGEGRHVRILNADWNDLAIEESGADRDLMIERGSSVLNSAMASWVLSVFGGLCDRLGEAALAQEARQQSDDLRGLVASAWNGRWFHRAYAPGGRPVGDEDCWLEVQPWAILCGAATDEQARVLIDHIDVHHRPGSPLGARVKWPADAELLDAGIWGTGTLGGTWFAIDMTLVWAAAGVDGEIAWDAWRRMTLGAHTEAYPDFWEGTLSGPDSWNGPEFPRAGRTWVLDDRVAMQAFPVANLHSHAQPLLAYLRLLGVEPTADGSLRTGRGGEYRSRVFDLDADGHGRLDAMGNVTVASVHGRVRGNVGALRW